MAMSASSTACSIASGCSQRCDCVARMLCDAQLGHRMACDHRAALLVVAAAGSIHIVVIPRGPEPFRGVVAAGFQQAQHVIQVYQRVIVPVLFLVGAAYI